MTQEEIQKEANNEELAMLEEAVRTAEKAKEPGETKVGEVLETGGEETGPTKIASIESAGYVYIYDTRTYERSVTNKNMLRDQLKKKRPDGSHVFTTVKPKPAPRRGKQKCWLYPSDPNRGEYDRLGLPVCMKSNLTSPYQVTRHMQKRHPAEWATIEKERTDKEKEEDRKFQRMILKQATAKKK